MALGISDTFTRSFELPPCGGQVKGGMCGNRCLIIHQHSVGDVGCVVWDAAISLGQLLAYSDFFATIDWSEKHVIELGAGTGLVGLVAAALGANVLITDLPKCLILMQHNCKSLEPLVSTLRQLCTTNTNILMSYEERTTGDKLELTKKFFQMVEEEFFVEELASELLPEQYRCPDIHIVAMARKASESQQGSLLMQL